ncbi:MAG: hypothetical protein ACFFCW_18090 [Candidatus Hodarchaeota archaeon]
MKKLVIPLIILCLVMVFAAVPTFAHTQEEPFVTDLTAGGGNPDSAMPVGVVRVWNDCENLYVQFDTNSSGECMVATHVHVADSLAGIPQTKKGNPIPGQFEWSEPHGCVLEKTYTIPLTWATETALFIAAHAALGQEEAMAIVSGDGQTIVTQRRSGNESGFTPVNAPAFLAWEPGPDYPEDGPDDSGWKGNSLWDQRLSTDLRPTGADWIWESYRVLDPIYGTVVTFQRTFDIGYPMDGELLIACDNGYEVFLNGSSLGSNGVIGEWRTSLLKQGSVPQDGWDAVGSYFLIDYLQSGMNTLTIDAANEYFNTDDYPNPYVGTESNNPAGCIFAAEISYYADGETAWGGDYWGTPLEFPGKNWAIYFNYTVQTCYVEFVEGGTLSVAYEDLPTDQGNDWDYNDFVVDIDVLATYSVTNTGGQPNLVKMDFTVRPEAKIAGYTHVMHLDLDAIACDGTYELYRDGSLVELGNYVDGTGIDVVLVPNTGSYPTEVFLTIAFPGDCEFSFPTWDPNQFHGENLFFDPYLHVNNTGQDIHTADVRMLTVPVDWQWPTPDGNRICNVYSKVTSCDPGPPTFVPDWWTP